MSLSISTFDCKNILSQKGIMLFGFLFLISFGNFSFSQLSNEAVFNQEVLRIAKPLVKETPVSRLDGIVTETIKSEILLDSLAKEHSLAIYLEEIRIESIGKGKFARYLQGSVNLVDTVERPHEFTFRDTLSRKNVPMVRKTKIESLKGNNPLVIKKLVVPLITIAASVGLVISLFYVRTQ